MKDEKTIEVTVDAECRETGMTWIGVKIEVDPASVRPDCDELVAYVRRSPEIGELCRQYLIGTDDVNFVVHNIDDAVAALARN